jgi:hypothetical protein
MQHLVGVETVPAANVFWLIKNPPRMIKNDKIVLVMLLMIFPPFFLCCSSEFLEGSEFAR